MIYQNVAINELIDNTRKRGWDGSFPVCSASTAHGTGYTMRRYAKLKSTGNMSDGDTISIGTKMDERWSRMLVAHILARRILYKETNFESTLEDIMKEDTDKQRKIKYFSYELIIPSDFMFHILVDRQQTNKMILKNTFGVPDEVFEERLIQLGIDLEQYKIRDFDYDNGSI